MNTIELQPEFQKALDSSEIVRAIDPRSNRKYVLLREESFERLKKLAYDDSPWTEEELERLGWEAGETIGWDEMDEYDYIPSKP
jgi:hypothetical protein